MVVAHEEVDAGRVRIDFLRDVALDLVALLDHRAVDVADDLVPPTELDDHLAGAAVFAPVLLEGVAVGAVSEVAEDDVELPLDVIFGLGVRVIVPPLRLAALVSLPLPPPRHEAAVEHGDGAPAVAHEALRVEVPRSPAPLRDHEELPEGSLQQTVRRGRAPVVDVLPHPSDSGRARRVVNEVLRRVVQDDAPVAHDSAVSRAERLPLPDPRVHSSQDVRFALRICGQRWKTHGLRLQLADREVEGPRRSVFGILRRHDVAVPHQLVDPPLHPPQMWRVGNQDGHLDLVVVLVVPEIVRALLGGLPLAGDALALHEVLPAVEADEPLPVQERLLVGVDARGGHVQSRVVVPPRGAHSPVSRDQRHVPFASADGKRDRHALLEPPAGAARDGGVYLLVLSLLRHIGRRGPSAAARAPSSSKNGLHNLLNPFLGGII